MLWVKAFHILFVTAWFAGLFYLPRIFVNVAMETGAQSRARLLLMARKLYRFMTILAVPAIAFGLWLWLGYGIGAGTGWMHAKLVVVLLLIGYHVWCLKLLLDFKHDRNTKSHLWYRLFNEVPTVLLLATVIFAVVKPF